ncbi:hypothetical protein SRB5_26520 [Streptomyces sp. RB5]|uniref:NAD(P)-binding domain-containing protein n=1 Tax=Streptomyces smaragdinus TaxID=2585196 RepID=A0A7K0CGB9_9ACTN|nr:NAD(P)H-binding protein [Streptomyces smaragdinus]MQY12517.1 hypothetical protein [Streptomyces smaragdinus]
MSKIAVIGAGGRVGRRIVGEAVRRGHDVTPVVRDPARYEGAVRGDVTDPASVAAAVAGHDAVVSSVYTPGVPSGEFFPASARALLAGLTEAGVGRLVVVGLLSTLTGEDGRMMLDDPSAPAEAREFSLGRAAELAVYREHAGPVDWVIVNPPLLLDYEGADTGSYTAVPERYTAGPLGRISPADLALAVVDRINTPGPLRTQISVAS